MWWNLGISHPESFCVMPVKPEFSLICNKVEVWFNSTMKGWFHQRQCLLPNLTVTGHARIPCTFLADQFHNGFGKPFRSKSDVPFLDFYKIAYILHIDESADALGQTFQWSMGLFIWILQGTVTLSRGVGSPRDQKLFNSPIGSFPTEYCWVWTLD